MDRKIKIINTILMSIMTICFFPVVIYLLMYLYNKLQLNICTSDSFKSNIGDIIIFFVMPIVFIIMGIYQYFLNRYYKLVSKIANEEIKDDIESEDNTLKNNIGYDESKNFKQ